jgi:dihydroorotase
MADPVPHDLAIVGGRLIDPAASLDRAANHAIAGGRIAAVQDGDTRMPARQTIQADGLVVVPGLIDLHTHVYTGVSHYGVDADEYCLMRGVTTAVDAGSAGAQTFPGFRRLSIEPARTRVLAYLHVAVQGMISARVGELEDVRWASPSDAAARANEHADVIVGIKVRLGYQMVGLDAEPALRMAREAADLLDVPLMVHIIDMPMPVTRLLPLMGEGDVVTHCFHGHQGSILDDRGRVVPAVVDAVRRGVVLDVGHGIGSFDFDVARRALAQGLPPTTISSDIHAHNVDGPAFDQPTTLSKLLHLGMPLADVVAAATTAPAAAVRAADRLGSLQVGREADVTVLEVRSGAWRLTDGARKSVVAERLLVPRWTVRGGRVHELRSPVPDLVRVQAGAA